MADLVALWGAPDEPLDCLYLLMAEGDAGVSRLVLPDGVGQLVARTVKQLGARGIAGEVLVTASPSPHFRRLACYGLGPPGAFSVNQLRALLARLVARAGDNREYQIAVASPFAPADLGRDETRALTLAELALADYRFHRFFSRPNEAGRIDAVHVVPLVGETESHLAELLEKAGRLDALLRVARDLANRPVNEFEPAGLAGELVEMFKASPVRATVMTAKELAKDGLGGILATAGAGEPHLLRLEYRAKKPRSAMVLVGPAGPWSGSGVDLDPRAGAAGAAAVVAAMRSVADEQPALKVVGLVPLVGPGARGLRVGEVVTLCNQKTVEVDGAGAAARVVVADCLAFAARFNPQTVVDLSTITPSCATVLGNGLAGLFTTDEDLARQIGLIGSRTGDRVWRLPVLPEHARALTSSFADLRSGARVADPLPLGVAFLGRHAPAKARWAHLDLAGVASVTPSSGGSTPAASGWGVRLLLGLLADAGTAS
jgi:leucyl aminopeptidase